MTAIDPIANLTGGTVTQAQEKTWFTNMRLYLVGLLGSDGLPATARTALQLDNMVAGINFLYSTVASAATPDIFNVTAGTSVGNTINFTGTATVTGFAAAPQAGAMRVLVCAAACSFTAGANLVIDGLASGSTYTASAGDKCLVWAVSTTSFRMTIMKVDGTSMATGPLVTNTQNAGYTTVLSDAQKQIIMNTAGNFTVPANGTVAYPVGTAISWYNASASSTVTVTTDTLRLAGTSTTGVRTLAQYALATMIKEASTTWVMSGPGVS